MLEDEYETAKSDASQEDSRDSDKGINYTARLQDKMKHFNQAVRHLRFFNWVMIGVLNNIHKVTSNARQNPLAQSNTGFKNVPSSFSKSSNNSHHLISKFMLFPFNPDFMVTLQDAVRLVLQATVTERRNNARLQKNCLNFAMTSCVLWTLYAERYNNIVDDFKDSKKSDENFVFFDTVSATK